MANYTLSPPSGRTSSYSLQEIADSFNRNWFRGLLMGLGLYVLFFKDISVQFNINAGASSLSEPVVISPQGVYPQQPAAMPASYNQNRPQNVSTIATPAKAEKNSKKWDSRKANDFSNLTFVLSPDYASRHNVHPDIARQKVNNCKKYVEEFAPAALKEMKEI